MRKLKIEKILNYLLQIILILAIFVLGYMSGTMIRKYYISYKSNQAQDIKEEKQVNPVEDNVQSLTIDGTKYSVPPQSASNEEKGEFSAKMMALAKSTEKVLVQDCQLTPPVISISIGSKLEIRNEGESQQTIRLGEKELRIKPASSEMLDTSQDFSLGLYGLSCNDSSLAGMVYFVD